MGRSKGCRVEKFIAHHSDYPRVGKIGWTSAWRNLCYLSGRRTRAATRGM